MTQPFDPEAFAQRQLDAYNARDLERFVREFTEDVVVYRLPDTNPATVGREALADHYRRNRFFWAYIGFSQYFLIWYGNIPEETFWYRVRLEGSWRIVTIALAIGHFAVPFFFLLPRAVKRHSATLVAAAVWLLLMHSVDVYWLVIPSVGGLRVRPGIVDVEALVAVGGGFLAVFGWLLVKEPLVPVGDPRLAESLAFENV